MSPRTCVSLGSSTLELADNEYRPGAHSYAKDDVLRLDRAVFIWP